MPKLKDIIPENIQIKMGEVMTEKDFPPFAVTEEEWKKLWDNKLNEAPMDKGFQKEWERSSKVLMTHLKHEIKQNPKLKRYFTQLLNYVERASEVPAAMAAKLGTN